MSGAAQWRHHRGAVAALLGETDLIAVPHERLARCMNCTCSCCTRRDAIDLQLLGDAEPA
jgi:hypothetical protein